MGRLAIATGADSQDRQSWKIVRQLTDNLQRLVVVGVEGDHGHVRIGLANDVRKELVACRFLLQPNGLDAEQQVAERLSGRIGGIDDGNALHVLHEHHRIERRDRSAPPA